MTKWGLNGWGKELHVRVRTDVLVSMQRVDCDRLVRVFNRLKDNRCGRTSAFYLPSTHAVELKEGQKWNFKSVPFLSFFLLG